MMPRALPGVLAVLLSAVPASAAPPAATLSDRPPPGAVASAVGPRGAVVAWVDASGALVAAARRAHRWESARVIWRIPAGGSGRIGRLAAAVDGQGSVAVAWEWGGVRVASIGYRERWRVHRLAAEGGYRPQLGGGAGTAGMVATWWRLGRVRYALRAWDDGWSPARLIPGQPEPPSPPLLGDVAPRLAVRPDGGAVVAWNDVRTGGTSVRASVRPSRGLFGPVTLLASDVRLLTGVGASRWGLTAAWDEAGGTFARAAGASGDWGPRLALPAPFGPVSGAPQAAPGGALRAVWAVGAPDPTARTVAAGSLPAGATAWRLRTVVAATASPAVALDASGTAWAAWRVRSGSDPRIVLARRDGSGWRTRRLAAARVGGMPSRVMTQPSVAAGGGRVIVTWTDCAQGSGCLLRAAIA